MSRAFTKEDDAGEDLPELPVPPGPNYVTPRGLELLKEAGQKLVEQKKKAAAEGGDVRPMDRDLRYLEARVQSAIVVPKGTGTEIRFGARVTIEDEKGETSTFQIVGEDEARTSSEYRPWSAPIVEVMFGASVGDTAEWQGVRYKIKSVSY